MRAQECVIDGFRLWIEDDVLCLQANGPMTAAIVDGVQARSLEILSHHPDYYILGDLRDAGLIPSGLRRRLAEYGAQHPPRAIALYNVGIVIHGINALLFGAMNALSRRKQPLKHCATEAEARAWLQTQRPARSGP